jgi:hypothetical protein
MREQFQRAFSDLTASSELVKRVRVNPDILHERYDLTDLEWRRLTAIVSQPGMECNCILYRANRLAPIVINLPDLCTALDKDLRELLSEYWVQHTQLSDNFWIESYDFCDFVRRKIASGIVSETVLATLEVEQSVVVEQLIQIYPERYGAGIPLTEREASA